MTGGANLLLLADRSDRQDLLHRIASGDLVHCCTSPYDAIEEMSRRSWPAVALSSRGGDLPGLCRAARRLQGQTSLFALCTPVDEPNLRPLVGKVLDDYFIYPPTRQDIAQLRGIAAGTALACGPGRASPAAGAVAPAEFTHMVDSVRNVSALERGVAEVVSRRLGMAVRWVDAQRPAAAQPLVLLVGENPRALIAQGRTDSRRAEAGPFLAAVQHCLPALYATAQRAESLHRLAITDHLTGTYNRRYFYHLTDQILARAAAKNFSVTLLLYDIDDFKRYNDTYGYAAGDEILRDTAAMMKDITRAHDIVSRIGGDEFAVLFWDADEPRLADSAPPETACALADRFRLAVERHHFKSLGPEAVGALTISGGLASFGPQGQTCRDLLRQANLALKAAKESGKNGIQLVGARQGEGAGE